MPDHPPHPRSLISRLSKGNEKWVAAVKDIPGSDVFLVVDAMAHITDLTAKLAATRKHLKIANRALENKAIRLENLGRLLHRRSGELLPATLRQMASAERFAELCAVPTLQEAQNAAREAGMSEKEALEWFEDVALPHSSPPTLSEDLLTRENLHQTTP